MPQPATFNPQPFPCQRTSQFYHVPAPRHVPGEYNRTNSPAGVTADVNRAFVLGQFDQRRRGSEPEYDSAKDGVDMSDPAKKAIASPKWDTPAPRFA